MKNYILSISVLMFILSLTTGCGNPSVTGKVLLSDGTPVTVGKVYFEKGSFSATGTIKEDGSYKMGTEKDGDGVPPGKYKIAIMGAIKNKLPEDAKNDGKGGLGMVTVRAPVSFENLVAQKYTSVSTSGLEIEVKGSMKHDIVVEAPEK